MAKDDVDEDYFHDWSMVLNISDGVSPEDAWTRARSTILQSKEFSEDEKKLLECSSLKSVAADLRELEAKHARESRFRRLTSKSHLKPLLDGLVNLDTAITSLASADPHGVAPLVWGGISIICKATQAILKIPEALIDFLNRIGWTLSRLQLYEKLSSRPPRLNRIMMHVFIKYLSLCLYLRDSFIKDGSLRHRWRTTLKFGSEAFTGLMTEKISDIDKLCADAHQEAQLAVANALLTSAASFQQALLNQNEAGKKLQEAEFKRERLNDLERAKREFLKWLRQVPAEEDLHKLLEDQLEGTCQWIDDDNLISAWLRIDTRKSSLLWISGGPGTGKTILSAHIISQLQYCHPAAYFFCKSDDQRKQTTTAVLQNWIWQLVHESSVLPESVTKASDEHQSPSILILSKIILELQQHLKRTYLIVDGLDECTDDVTEFLRCCHILSQEWCVLIISRDVLDIKRGLQPGTFAHKALTTRDNEMDINSFVIHKAISIQDTKEDIDNLVSQKIGQVVKTKSWEAMEKGIAHVLSANAEGMFLWVRLVLDFLLEDVTLESDLEDALGSIPSDLYGFYDKIMEKMKAQSSRWKMTQRALNWIVYAFRPLTVEELHAAIAFELNSSKAIENFELILHGTCGLLIRINDDSKEITMIHATVKEYLLQAMDTTAVKTERAELNHARITTTCLAFLCANAADGVFVDEDMQRSDQRFQAHFDSRPRRLLDYSVIYWCQHLYKSQHQSSQWRDTLHQVLSSDGLIVSWLQLFQYLHTRSRPGTLETAEMLHKILQPTSDNTSLKEIFQHEKLSLYIHHLGLADGGRFIRWARFLDRLGDYPRFLPILLIAAFFDFVDVIKREIRRRVDIETKSHRGGTALLWAARGGSVDAVKFLVAKKVNVNDQSRKSLDTPLAHSISLEAHSVSFPGTFPIVHILLAGGADPNMRTHDGWSALNILVDSNNADSDGEIAVVKLIFEYSPYLWKGSVKKGWSILYHAILRNKPTIADAILKEVYTQDPKDVSMLLRKHFEDDRPLHFALRENPSFVSVLLKHGANVSAPDARGVLPLQFAAQYDIKIAAEALIEHGCDVNETGRWNTSPLTIALENQSMSVASILLDMGAKREEVPESLILLPRTEILDDRIGETMCSDLPLPLCTKDIYQICFHFKENFFLPIPITAQILDLAELWIESSVIKKNPQIYKQQNYNKQNSSQKTYLRSAPIVGRERKPVQKLCFTITSHDQGFDDNQGSSGNYTWFEMMALPGGDIDKGRVMSEPVHNRLANWEWYTHQVTWLHSRRLQSWDILKPGDRVSVIACSLLPGWCNYVREMRIDVFTSILRRHYTRSEVSDIWGSKGEGYLRASDHTNKSAPKTTLPTSISLRSHQRPRLQILAAAYGPQDVTSLIAELVTDDRRLELDTNKLDESLGDPWVGFHKTFSVLYQIDDDAPDLLITTQKQGTITIDPSLAERKAAASNPKQQSEVEILAIVYGRTEIRSSDIYAKINIAIVQRQDLLVSNETFGGDTWFGYQKSGVVYYRWSNGPVILSAAKEYTHMNFER